MKRNFVGFWKRLLGVYDEPKHHVICLLGLKIKIRSKYLMMQQALEEKEREIEELRHRIGRSESQIAAIQDRLDKMNRIDEILMRLRSLEQTRGERGKLLVEMNRRLGGINKSVNSMRGELSNKITVQEKRTEQIYRDAVARDNSMEKKINYTIWKYMAPEKYAVALSDRYYRMTGSKLNLDNPQTYNEKIQWMKLYDSTPIKTRLADKYLVRDWVAERIGEQYLIPLLGVWDSFDEIDFDALPERFVLKCNHGCGYNLIVKNKAELNREEAKRKINTWLGEDFAFRAGFELHYSPIPRKIIAEQYIENKDSDGDLYDYKFWCFDGKVEYIQFLSERNISGLKMAFYDKSWVKQNFVYSFPLDEKDIERPGNLDEMILLAEKLAADFNHVRVDLYRMDDGRVYFGEMTFTSASGNCKWIPAEMDRIIGDMMVLPAPTPFCR